MQEGPKQNPTESKAITIQYDREKQARKPIKYDRETLLGLRNSPESQSWPFSFTKENIPTEFSRILGDAPSEDNKKSTGIQKKANNY